MMASALRRLLEIAPQAAAFEALGFAPCAADARARLEHALEVFIAGYNAALAARRPDQLAAELRAGFDAHHVGFAFEGAGMGYALLDLLSPWRPSRLRAFVEGPGREHDYIATVGAGFALARVPWGLRAWRAYARRLDPLLSWCLADGYGFHQGVFHPRRCVDRCAVAPARFDACAQRLFDAGLGRSLWWSRGAAPRRIARAIAPFPSQRRSEMWCGVGLAAAYAGGGDENALDELIDLAGDHRLDLLSGLPFAARMRQKGGNPSPVTERAARRLLGRSAGEAADWITRAVASVLADERVERATRVRDSYVLVRARLVAELAEAMKGDEPCRSPAHGGRLTIA